MSEQTEGAQAVADLRGRGRRADGTAGEGNLIALKHGRYSEQLQTALSEHHAARVAAIAKDLGGAEELTAIEASLVGDFATVELVAESLRANVLQHGALTGKGNARASMTAYLKVVFQKVHLAKLLGLKRRQRAVTSFSQAVAEAPEHE